MSRLRHARPGFGPVSRLVFGLVLGLITGLITGLIGLAAAGVAQAYAPPPVRGHVNDTASVLTRAHVQSLESELSRVRQQHGFDVVVLIVASLAGEPIEDVAYDTFNTWGIGGEQRDDGVLLVVAVAEQSVRIETGKGVGGALTDIESGRIIREQIKPLVVAGQWYEATAVGTRAITEALTGVAGPRGPPAPGTTGGTDDTVQLTLVQKILIGVGLVVVTILAIIFPGVRRALFWILLAFMRSRGGGGGGGGGRIGGGGRSGGGGASG